MDKVSRRNIPLGVYASYVSREKLKLKPKFCARNRSHPQRSVVSIYWLALSLSASVHLITAIHFPVYSPLQFHQRIWKGFENTALKEAIVQAHFLCNGLRHLNQTKRNCPVGFVYYLLTHALLALPHRCVKDLHIYYNVRTATAIRGS